jgi:WD repeat-containing protein 48
MSDGECVVLAREGDVTGDYESKSGDEGIRCITAMDDEYVWTATGSAELRRWKDVGRRVDRLEFEGASYGVAAASPNEALALGHAFAPPDGVLRNKRLSVDEEPLSRTDSRSVAFAPPPTSASPSAIPSTVRDRLNPPRTTFSGASIASSIVSDSSAADDVVPAHSSSLNGIPYESLVCLGLPDSPYSFGFRDDAHSHRPGSIASVPQGMNALVDGSPRKVSVQLDSGSMAQLARLKFEDREIASEAVPLRKTPDEVVAGRSGLVRSLLLNDRQHVLTVDTQGEVAAWNIIRGVCIGRFSSADVAAAFDIERGVAAGQAVRKHSNEVLELVKDRVEGETMVITWCQVDTKIGSLVVHLEEGRVFDAEVYADELGLEGYEGIREDMRRK